MLYGLRILAVDDDPDTVELYKAFLECHRADVCSATSGAKALPLVRPEWKPHALVTHVRLPDMRGAELAIAVEKEAGKRVPAIATTSDARPKACEDALADGFARCLVKPVELDALADAIRAVVSPMGDAAT